MLIPMLDYKRLYPNLVGQVLLVSLLIISPISAISIVVIVEA